jgi:hypothetical protein
MKRILIATLLLTGLAFGSATIFKGSYQNITIDSDPQGATVMIDGVNKGLTPLSINIEKNEAKNVIVKKDGYRPRTIGMSDRFDFLTLLGGYSSTTDLINGNAWEYSPTNFYFELKKK